MFKDYSDFESLAYGTICLRNVGGPRKHQHLLVLTLPVRSFNYCRTESERQRCKEMVGKGSKYFGIPRKFIL